MLLLKGTWKGLKKKQCIPTLTLMEEESLCSYIWFYASRAVPLSTAMVRTFATLLANRKGRLCDQKFKGKARVGWFQKFKRHHPEITLRNPASVDMGRVSMSSECVVEDHLQVYCMKSVQNASGMWTKLASDRYLFNYYWFLVYQTWVAN